MLYHIYTDIYEIFTLILIPPKISGTNQKKTFFYKMQKERCRDDYAKNRPKKVLEW